MLASKQALYLKPTSSTPLLDEETAVRLRIAVARLSRALRPTSAGQAIGLTPTRASVLLTIVREGEIGLSALATREGLNPTMLSRAISALVEAGLVARVSDDDDRRAAWVKSTAAGRKLAERMRRERTDAVNRGAGRLSEAERRALERALPALEALAEQLRTGGHDPRDARRARHLRRPPVPNYRRYYGGQAISLIGTWMQMTAQAWLVLTLTHSSTWLGVMIALQTLPGPDPRTLRRRHRRPRRQAPDDDRAPERDGRPGAGPRPADGDRHRHGGRIGVLAALLGLNNAFENPARQSFMLELVGPEHLRNAVSLNSVLVNVARTIGPAVAGILIATVGDGVCFLVNAGSFVAVVASLVTMDRAALSPEPADSPRRRSAARGPALRARHARARHAAADDGGRRLPDLRVPGHAAGDGRSRPGAWAPPALAS